MHERSWFLTLTFDREHLPADWSLDVRTWQLFAKKLRKDVGPFRFFACGEYGPVGLRPHYHACVFGLPLEDVRQVVRDGRVIGHSPALEAVWQKGDCDVQPFSAATAGYVTGYVTKKRQDIPIHAYNRIESETGRVFQVRREFRVMSRRPGIGATWYARYKSDVFPSDVIVHEGSRFRPPRFYSDKLSDAERADVRARRLKAVEKQAEHLTPERLRVRERCAEGRIAFFNRSHLE